MGLDVTSLEHVYRVIAEAASLGSWLVAPRCPVGHLEQLAPSTQSTKTNCSATLTSSALAHCVAPAGWVRPAIASFDNRLRSRSRRRQGRCTGRCCPGSLSPF